jgi:hypothetical protein
MGFFSKLKKVVDGIDKGATVASEVLPGKPGEVATEVGVVTSIVQQIQTNSAPGQTPEEAQKNATLVTAVAVDDHEQRLLQMEKTIQDLQAALAAAQSKPQGEATGQTTGQSTGQTAGQATGQAAGQTTGQTTEQTTTGQTTGQNTGQTTAGQTTGQPPGTK